LAARGLSKLGTFATEAITDGFGLAADTYGVVHVSRKGIKNAGKELGMSGLKGIAFGEDLSPIAFIADLIPGVNMFSTGYAAKEACF
jgi:hypothetical protein